MSVRIEHVALWARDIDNVAAFYVKYFGARVGERYRNPAQGFCFALHRVHDAARGSRS